MPFDMTSFQAAATSFKAATDLIKFLLDIRNTPEVSAKVIELNARIMEAQSHTMIAQAQTSTYIERIGELEKRIAEFENWELEKQRYELHEVRAGVFVYALKEDARGGEPAHQICANCYQAGVKSLLQVQHLAVGRATLLVCQRCGGELIKDGARMSHQPSARR